jgi:hypothetical protein
MHMVIRAIVYSKYKDGALDEARSVFEKLVDNGDPFDYYQMFDSEGTSVSGRGRWGKLTPVAKVDSKAGKKLIDEGMKYTRDRFNIAIKAIKEGIANYTENELFEDEKAKVNGMLGMFKYYCHVIGNYRGPSVYLYDNDGEGIRNKGNLKDVLSKWKCIYEDVGKENPYKDMSVWVVPADVHY